MKLGLRRLAGLAPLAALLLGAGLAASCGGSPPPDSPRGVVLVLLDTVRADHLGSYGYERPTSPHLDALAAEGVRFESALASAPWTLPSVAAILAGQYSERAWNGFLTKSLVEDLQRAGVRTAAFTEGVFVSERFGFDRGFDAWSEKEGNLPMRRRDGRPASEPGGGIDHTFAAAEAWLAENADAPFFLLIHTYEPHAPYTHRRFAKDLDPGRLGETFSLRDLQALRDGELELTEGELRYVTALYDGDLERTDRALGGLLETLKQLDLSNRVAVIVTSDHGEDLGSRYARNRFDHGHALRDELMKVPLVLYDPARDDGGRVVEAPVRSIDILPTVAELLGVPVPGDHADGRSLVGLLDGEEQDERLALLGQTRWGPRRVGLRTADHKYIHTVPSRREETALEPSPPRRQLYDLGADPGETRNLVRERPELATALFELLAEEHPGTARRVGQDLGDESDPDWKARLEALGYVR